MAEFIMIRIIFLSLSILTWIGCGGSGGESPSETRRGDANYLNLLQSNGQPLSGFKPFRHVWNVRVSDKLIAYQDWDKALHVLDENGNPVPGFPLIQLDSAYTGGNAPSQDEPINKGYMVSDTLLAYAGEDHVLHVYSASGQKVLTRPNVSKFSISNTFIAYWIENPRSTTANRLGKADGTLSILNASAQSITVENQVCQFSISNRFFAFDQDCSASSTAPVRNKVYIRDADNRSVIDSPVGQGRIINYILADQFRISDTAFFSETVFSSIKGVHVHPLERDVWRDDRSFLEYHLGEYSFSDQILARHVHDNRESIYNGSIYGGGTQPCTKTAISILSQDGGMSSFEEGCVLDLKFTREAIVYKTSSPQEENGDKKYLTKIRLLDGSTRSLGTFVSFDTSPSRIAYITMDPVTP